MGPGCSPCVPLEAFDDVLLVGGVQLACMAINFLPPLEGLVPHISIAAIPPWSRLRQAGSLLAIPGASGTEDLGEVL